MSFKETSIQSQFNLNADSSDNKKVYEFEGFRLDSSHLMLYRQDEVIPLAPKVVETLLALVERPGEILSKDEMMQRLWADSFVEEANLTQNIYLLRKTLGKTADGREVIETFRRRGYRFSGEVKKIKNTGETNLTAADQTKISTDNLNDAPALALSLRSESDNLNFKYSSAATTEINENRFLQRVKDSSDVASAANSSDENQILAAPPPARRKERVSRKLFWSFLAGGAVFGVSLLMIYVASRFFLQDFQKTPTQSDPSNITLTRLTQNQTTFNPAISPDGKFVAYAKQEENGDTALWLRNMISGQTTQILPATSKGYLGLQFSPDGRQIYYLTQREQAPKRNLARVNISDGTTEEIAKNVFTWFAISPDGGQIAFVRDTELIVAATDSSRAERTVAVRDGKAKWFSSENSQPSWSPDGLRIAASGGYVEQNIKRSEVVEIRLSDNSEKRINTPPWDKIGSVVWVADGSGLYVSAREEANKPLQIWYLSYPNGKTQKITNDFHNYNSLNLTADSRQLVTEQIQGTSNLWITSAENSTQTKQLTFSASENIGVNGLAIMPDKRIVYTSLRSGNLDLWMMNPDGTDQKQLTLNMSAWNFRPRVSPNGRFIVFQSFHNNQSRIWRIDSDGRNAIQLTDGDGEQYFPDITPDGQWVYYASSNASQTSIWKIPINGGEPMRVSSEVNAGSPSLSPDGKLLVCQYQEKSTGLWKIGIMSTETGRLTKFFDLTAVRREIDWTADSKALVYIARNSPNLWQRPIADGNGPRQLTNFNLEQTWNFAFSPDKQQVVFARGNVSTETVLISNLSAE